MTSTCSRRQNIRRSLCGLLPEHSIDGAIRPPEKVVFRCEMCITSCWHALFSDRIRKSSSGIPTSNIPVRLYMLLKLWQSVGNRSLAKL